MRLAALVLVASLAMAPAAYGQGSPSTVRGIDVSDAQGKIDWDKVAKSGIKFAFIRVSDGFHLDEKFERNWEHAKKAGIVRGAYQYFRPSLDGAKQAQDFLSRIPDLGATGDLPPVCDVETLDGVSSKKLAKELRKWVDLVEARIGRKPLIYTAPGLWGDWHMPSYADHPLWVAHWTKAANPRIPAGFTTWLFWQHSAHSKVPGISGPVVDADLFHGTLDELKAFAATGALPAAAAGSASVGLASLLPGDDVQHPVLRLGDKGEAVRRLQRLLREQGAAIEVDGAFGEATDAAVRALQKKRHLAVDGIVGIRTWAALEG